MGLYRLEAANLLGWAEIDCTITSLEGLQAELAEIDENMTRHNPNYLEEGEQLARRKEIYETLQPETRQGKRSDEHFAKMSAGYEAEQAWLADSIQKLTVALSEKKDKTANISRFLSLVKRNLSFEDLTRDVLNTFIQKIVVHEMDKSSHEIPNTAG